MTIEIYTKPNCVQCTATYKRLDSKGLEYTPVDILADAKALEYVKSEGFLQAPVAFVKDAAGNIIDKWSGFRPDKIDALATATV